MGGAAFPQPPIPADVRKTIQTIKEIAGSHSEEEIYVTLKESNMDPDETAQRLLHQDHFHEVRRKREKKKENATGKEYGDMRVKSGNQGRGGRGNTTERGVGQRTYLPHSHSTISVPGTYAASESKDLQKASAFPLAMQLRDSVSEGNISLSVGINQNQSIGNIRQGHITKDSWSAIAQGNTSTSTRSRSNKHLNSIIQQSSSHGSFQDQVATDATSVSESLLGSSDSSLMSAHSHWIPQSGGKTKCETDSCIKDSSPVDQSLFSYINSCSTMGSNSSESSNYFNKHDSSEQIESSINFKLSLAVSSSDSVDSTIVSANELIEVHPSKMKHSTSSGSCATVHQFSSQSGNVCSTKSELQRVSQGKVVEGNIDWKPESSHQISANSASELSVSQSKMSASDDISSSATSLQDQTGNLQARFQGLNLRDDQCVIIADHLQVNDAGCESLTFGSFRKGASVPGLDLFQQAQLDVEQESKPTSEIHVSFDEDLDALTMGNFHDQIVSLAQIDNISVKTLDASEEFPTTDIARSEIGRKGSLYPEIVVDDKEDRSLSHLRQGLSYQQDVPHVQDFVHYNRSSNIYTPFSRPNPDADAHGSLISGSTVNFYSPGSHGVMASQSTSSAQEGINYMISSTSDPAIHVRQNSDVNHAIASLQESASGISQSSIGNPQTSNFSAYQQYFSPFYDSTSGFGFPGNLGHSQDQGASNSNMANSSSYYQTSLPMNYPLSLYNPTHPNGNAFHSSIASAYGGYSIPTGLSSTASVSGVDTFEKSLFKGRDMFVHQNRANASTAWNPLMARELSGMHPGSYYNIPAQAPNSMYAEPSFNSVLKSTQVAHVAYPGAQAQSTYHTRYRSQPEPSSSANLLEHSQALGRFENSNGDMGLYQQQQGHFWNNAF